MAEAKGLNGTYDAKVVSLCERYADRDHLAEAEAFRLYFIDGAGENRKVRSLEQTWGTGCSAPRQRRSATHPEAAPRRRKPPAMTPTCCAGRWESTVWTTEQWEPFIVILKRGFLATSAKPTDSPIG